jgi:hypothetical protein
MSHLAELGPGPVTPLGAECEADRLLSTERADITDSLFRQGRQRLRDYTSRSASVVENRPDFVVCQFGNMERRRPSTYSSVYSFPS